MKNFIIEIGNFTDVNAVENNGYLSFDTAREALKRFSEEVEKIDRNEYIILSYILKADIIADTLYPIKAYSGKGGIVKRKNFYRKYRPFAL